MLQALILTVFFSIFTVASIVLLGSKAIISGEMNFARLIQILFSWQFIAGAFFALGARLLFVMINSTLYRIPALSESSTTVTTLITTLSLVFVIIANYFFLDERISTAQIVGAVIIFIGIFLVAR